MIAVDGSEQADHAFEWYLKNSWQSNDYVYGVTCVEYEFGGMSILKQVGPLADHQALTETFREQHKQVEKLCADYTARLRTARVKGQVDYISGKKPGFAVVEFAGQVKADVIIMGTRGLGAIKRMVQGSVSSYVKQNAPCPVTVIPFKNPEQKKERKKSDAAEAEVQLM